MPRLSLYSHASDGYTFVRILDDIAVGWNRTKKLQGGCGQGTFRLLPIDDHDEYLVYWFYNRLGQWIEEEEGGVTWGGKIYEMHLCYHGKPMRRSLDDMYNSYTGTYTDSGTGNPTAITPTTNTLSIARYGTRVQNLDLTDGPQYPLATADAKAAADLKVTAWPWQRPDGETVVDGDTYLDVIVQGEAYSLNWTLVSATSADGSTTDVSDWIADIFDTDADQFCTKGSITANTLQVKRTLSGPIRCWDAIQQAVALGDASGNFYRAWVDGSRIFHYAQVDMTNPMYYKFQGVYYDSVLLNQQVNPWQMSIGLVRDLDYPYSQVEDGSIYADARDFMPDEISVDWEGNISLLPADLDQEALADAQRRNEAILAETEEAQAVKKPKLSKRRRQKIRGERPKRKQGGA